MNDEERDAVPGEDHEADPFAGREGALATEALVATLAPSGLPEGGWERLAAAVSARAGAARPAERPTVGPAVTGATLRPAPRRPLAYAALAVAVLALGGVGAWGLVQRAEAARLRDDQRILAYWMSNPGMVLTPLQPADGAAGARLGVLCVLPDGRALVLQPNRPERGATYVVVGRGEAGARELARGSENMLQFDVTGVDVVELRTERGERSQVLAVAQLGR